LINGTPLITT